MQPPDWSPPDHWTRIECIDAHTEGEPFRVIVDGLPDLPGETILARRRWSKENLDHLRTALMWEPRGHADMYGCIVTPPVSPEADLGILFLHNEGFSTMCGHGIIGICTVALETGMLPGREPETTIRIDTPAGLVTAHAMVHGGRVAAVRFHNVPSFVLALDGEVEVDGIGTVRYDLAFGGAFYAYLDAGSVGLKCEPADYGKLIDIGKRIKRAVMESRPILHPFEEDLSFLYGVVFTGQPADPANFSRNVCVFADGEVDRSPTGTSVSARLAIHHARGEIGVGERVVFESILGTTFAGKVVEPTTFGPHDAVVPEVEGSAHITGRHTFLLDPEDPLRDGFLLR